MNIQPNTNWKSLEDRKVTVKRIDGSLIRYDRHDVKGCKRRVMTRQSFEQVFRPDNAEVSQ